MFTRIDALSITQFHDRALQTPQAEDMDANSATAWHWIALNHRCNTRLWDEEDRARRTDVEAAEIAAGKHRIDQHNQDRNDAVEAIDETILAQLGAVAYEPGARQNSETAGAMIDRLSILALKIFHMRAQSMRGDAGIVHISTCQAKLDRLQLQRRELAACLDQLLADAAAGRAYFKVYRQFKMYNDPALNPYLYPRAGHSADAPGAP
jgi:hypothetical protein